MKDIDRTESQPELQVDPAFGWSDTTAQQVVNAIRAALKDHDVALSGSTKNNTSRFAFVYLQLPTGQEFRVRVEEM